MVDVFGAFVCKGYLSFAERNPLERRKQTSHIALSFPSPLPFSPSRGGVGESGPASPPRAMRNAAGAGNAEREPMDRGSSPSEAKATLSGCLLVSPNQAH